MHSKKETKRKEYARRWAQKLFDYAEIDMLFNLEAEERRLPSPPGKFSKEIIPLLYEQLQRLVKYEQKIWYRCLEGNNVQPYTKQAIRTIENSLFLERYFVK